MSDYIEQLNDRQKAAVLDTEGYVLVLAGAGSGKTRVLTSRIAHLVNDKGVSPRNILAITFTNKAADEMKLRLSTMVEGCEEMWVMTIHSMCVRILRNSIGRLEGYDRNFSIYSEIDKNNVIKRILQTLNYDTDKYLKNAKFYISDAKNKGLSPAEFKRSTEIKDVEIYTQIYFHYEEELKKSNALDFDDLLLKAFELLDEDQEVLEFYANKFEYIHIDEFQDTNAIQFEIAKLLASVHGNLFVVGDDDQSIYSWRGAEIKNILGFDTQFQNASVHKLEQNYRSTKQILDLANTIIAGNTQRKRKTLWTENADGEKVVAKIAEDETEEAEFAAFTIKKLMNQGAKPSDFAVLMRINALSRSFEQEFAKYNIPFKVFGGFKFYDRKEIKDLTAYLRILINPLDNESILRIINVPKRGIGDKTIQVLYDYANEYGLSLYDGIVDCERLPLSASVINRLTNFKNVINSLLLERQNQSITQTINAVIEKSNFMSQFIDDTDENYSKKANVNEYISDAEQFEKKNPNADLSDYLNSITLSSDTDELEDGNFVSIATIHSVKGLEFENVFICGMDENVFPVSRASNSLHELEEERRLMYVAITRAQKRLFISRARNRFLYGSRQFTQESCFITELADKLGIPKRRRFNESFSDDGYHSRNYNGGRYSDYGGYGSSSGYGSRNNYGSDRYGSRGYDSDGYYPDYDYSSAQASYGGASQKPIGFSSSNSESYSSRAAKSFMSSGNGAKTGGQVKDYSQFCPGKKVKHPKFGEGVIVSTKDSGKDMKIDVAFKGVGVKSLAVAFAPLTLID